MKNLHKIEGEIPEFVKLVATRWHLNDENYLDRRVGSLSWDGKYLYEVDYPAAKVASAKEFLKTPLGRTYKDYFDARDYISVGLFQPDMIRIIK